MGPDDSNESRHSLPMGVGNDKRVDHSSLNVFWDPSRREIEEQNYEFTIQNQLQRFSVALTELRGRGRECGRFKAMRPLKMLKDMVDGCPPLLQAMSINNKGVLRVGVPSMQHLQKWAE